MGNDIYIPRPASPSEIEHMFADMINKTGITGQQREEMLRFPTDKKWQMVETQKTNEVQSTLRGSILSGAIGSGPVNPSLAPGRRAGSVVSDHDSILGTGSHKAKAVVGRQEDKPETYLGAFMDNTITSAKVASLNVGLRTYNVK